MGQYFEPVSPQSPLFRRFIHTRSDNFKYEHQSIDDDKNPFDFTGYTFAMHIRTEPDAADPPVVTIPDGSFSLDQSTAGAGAGVQDIWKINHAGSDFSDLDTEPVIYYFDIELTNPAGDVFTPVYGEFLIRADVTK